jgi:hypothetical protein
LLFGGFIYRQNHFYRFARFWAAYPKFLAAIEGIEKRLEVAGVILVGNNRSPRLLIGFKLPTDSYVELNEP